MYAYDMGYRSFVYGESMGCNPFDHQCEPIDFRMWRIGWFDARDEYEALPLRGW